VADFKTLQKKLSTMPTKVEKKVENRIIEHSDLKQSGAKQDTARLKARSSDAANNTSCAAAPHRNNPSSAAAAANNGSSSAAAPIHSQCNSPKTSDKFESDKTSDKFDIPLRRIDDGNMHHLTDVFFQYERLSTPLQGKRKSPFLNVFLNLVGENSTKKNDLKAKTNDIKAEKNDIKTKNINDKAKNNDKALISEIELVDLSDASQLMPFLDTKFSFWKTQCAKFPCMTAAAIYEKLIKLVLSIDDSSDDLTKISSSSSRSNSSSSEKQNSAKIYPRVFDPYAGWGDRCTLILQLNQEVIANCN
jgi:hypothetical protein